MHNVFVPAAPSVYNMQYSTFTNGSIKLVCQTRYSLSAINWYKNGVLMNLTGENIHVNEASRNRGSSYFESAITICNPPDTLVGNYSCNVSNNLGSDSEVRRVNGKIMDDAAS